MKRGRKAKLTNILIKRIGELVKKGVPKNRCFYLLDISHTAFYGWLQTGMKLIEEGKEDLTCAEKKMLELVASIKKAETFFIEDRIKSIKDANDLDAKNWTASAWLLERLYPDEWGKRDRIDHKIEAEVNFKKPDWWGNDS